MFHLRTAGRRQAKIPDTVQGGRVQTKAREKSRESGQYMKRGAIYSTMRMWYQ